MIGRLLKRRAADMSAAMKIVLLNDTSGHPNWGCIATSTGLKTLVCARWPEASFEAFPAESLPWKRLSPVRRYLERRIARAISTPSIPALLERALGDFGVDLARLDQADLVIMNGEGMIHSRSGHLVRLLGSLEYARRSGAQVAVVNQTVDVTPGEWKADLLSTVYSDLPLVCARDNASLALLHRLGIGHAILMPDAAFSTPCPSPDAIREVAGRLGLPEAFIAVTGSSALSKRDVDLFGSVLRKVRAMFDLPVVLLASTKTDLRLGEALVARGEDLRILDASLDWRDAVCVIATARGLVGGRFHPMVFAALVGTPQIGFEGNTHKVRGLMEMLDYPLGEASWRDEAGQEKALTALARDGRALAVSSEDSAARLAKGLACAENWSRLGL